MRCSPTRTPRGTPKRTWRYVPAGRIRPGKVWAYSNTNYLVLGELVRAVDDRPLAKEIRARLLDPLGLEHAWYQAVEKPRTELSTGYRLVPGPTGGARAVPVAPASDVMPFRSVVTAAGGAGSIAATAEDTARWMQAFAGGRVLSPAMQTAMLGDVAYTRALHARIPYGLGIQQVSIAGPARARPLRPIPGLPERGPLPAGGRRDDRGAHQPGGRRSRGGRGAAAEDRPAIGTACGVGPPWTRPAVRRPRSGGGWIERAARPGAHRRRRSCWPLAACGAAAARRRAAARTRARWSTGSRPG